ncbi:glutathione S-transferase [Enterobacteriaceae bacterium 4M9]|nr:glutathione S-transferase [Enterobacteriaceae bacterium 4M9]
MKLIGSYTSPYVRKISIMLLEKGITFEFVNESPWEPGSHVAAHNPLGKVPALVTDDGQTWFDSPVIAQYLELLDIAPALLPREPQAALWERQVEAVADGILDAAVLLVRERQRPAAQQSEAFLIRQREKIVRALDWLEHNINEQRIDIDLPRLGAIAIGCAIGYLNFRRVAAGWCASRPLLVRMADRLFERESFARTEPPAS